jgi:CRISPR/Cas system-associated protein Cas10 (large subunit of type III CRISPR-Cas system)
MVDAGVGIDQTKAKSIAQVQSLEELDIYLKWEQFEKRIEEITEEKITKCVNAITIASNLREGRLVLDNMRYEEENQKLQNKIEHMRKQKRLYRDCYHSVINELKILDEKIHNQHKMIETLQAKSERQCNICGDDPFVKISPECGSTLSICSMVGIFFKFSQW